MADSPTPLGEEKYLHGYGDEHRAFLSIRTAEREAAFFLPFIRPGMRLLDCGCGQGALTTSLAERLAPSEVIGIDREPSQVDAARAWAKAKGAGNVHFELGDAYALEYPDASFDAVFAYAVLEHLREPMRSLREMRRVLKPGGVVGLCDPDYGARLVAPEVPGPAELLDLMRRFSEVNGSPYYARHQRGYLLEAGFVRAEAFALATGGGNTQRLQFVYDSMLKPTLEAIRPWLVEHDLVTGARLDELLLQAEAWVARPDAFLGLAQCAAVAWAPD